MSGAQQGYPRRINHLCHNALRALVGRGGDLADEALVREIVKEEEAFV